MSGSGRLAGKAAVVTGAGSGIGRAVALRLGSEGARLVLSSRNPEHLAEVCAAVEAVAELPPLPVQADQSEPASAGEVVAKAREHLGRIDILSANAGIELVHEPAVEEIDDLEWDAVIGVNLTGTFRLCRAALPLMGRGSSIVTMGSVNSYSPRPGAAAYVASKGGLLQFTKALAIEVAPRGVRANCVCPGNIDTPLTDAFLAAAPDYELQRAAYAAESPMNRLGSAEEVANCVLFLASDESSFVTGTVLIVDGGMSIA